MFVYLIYPLKYRRLILWGAYLGVIFLPLLMLGNHAQKVESLSTKETVFFSFVAHQSLFWFMSILALLFGQLWCERRFARLEQ